MTMFSRPVNGYSSGKRVGIVLRHLVSLASYRQVVAFDTGRSTGVEVFPLLLVQRQGFLPTGVRLEPRHPTVYYPAPAGKVSEPVFDLLLPVAVVGRAEGEVLVGFGRSVDGRFTPRRFWGRILAYGIQSLQRVFVGVALLGRQPGSATFFNNVV